MMEKKMEGTILQGYMMLSSEAYFSFLQSRGGQCAQSISSQLISATCREKVADASVKTAWWYGY